MIPAPIPTEEPTRLSALHDLAVLDTVPEERFDRITRIARRLFDVPIALVSLVDTDRQWFKSCIGLDLTEAPRETSFCGHAIIDRATFVVEDACADHRFADNPFVTGEPGIRFYAGVPLAVGDGQLVGTLCVIDVKPRTFTEEDRQALRDLAGMVEQELSAVHIAMTDELTMIANRRGFLVAAAELLTSPGRAVGPATLVYVDLDGFKQINDRFGHAEGDRALALFSEALTTAFRSTDIVGRLGGDEFAVLLTDADGVTAQAALDRLRRVLDQRCAGIDVAYELEHSIGIVEFEPDHHLSLDALLAEADRRMYGDKHEACVLGSPAP